MSEYSSDRGSGRKGAVGSFCAGKKRRFEEISSSQSWAKKYDKTIPDDIMMLCSNDRYVEEVIKYFLHHFDEARFSCFRGVLEYAFVFTGLRQQ